MSTGVVPEMPEDRSARQRPRFPPASVIVGCLVGCLLPVFAYAQGMAAIYGFGEDRKWAWPLLLVPTVAWFAVMPNALTAVALGGQLLIAAVVSRIIMHSRRKRAV